MVCFGSCFVAGQVRSRTSLVARPSPRSAASSSARARRRRRAIRPSSPRLGSPSTGRSSSCSTIRSNEVSAPAGRPFGFPLRPGRKRVASGGTTPPRPASGLAGSIVTRHFAERLQFASFRVAVPPPPAPDRGAVCGRRGRPPCRYVPLNASFCHRKIAKYLILLTFGSVFETGGRGSLASCAASPCRPT
jgi:hypothetical protein